MHWRWVCSGGGVGRNPRALARAAETVSLCHEGSTSGDNTTSKPSPGARATLAVVSPADTCLDLTRRGLFSELSSCRFQLLEGRGVCRPASSGTGQGPQPVCDLETLRAHPEQRQAAEWGPGACSLQCPLHRALASPAQSPLCRVSLLPSHGPPAQVL